LTDLIAGSPVPAGADAGNKNLAAGKGRRGTEVLIATEI